MARRRTHKNFERPHRYGDDAPQPYWPTFAEKLLLALIDAYPQRGDDSETIACDSERSERLAEALDAVFNVENRRGPHEIYKLHALMSARETHLDEACAEFEKEILKLPKGQRTKTVSKRSIAQQIAPQVRGNSVETSAELLRASEREHRRYLSQIGVLGSHQEEEDMLRDLRMIERILARWNIQIRVDPEALGMASLWEKKATN